VTKRQQALLARLEEWFNQGEMITPSDAANALNIPIQAVEAIIKIGIHENRFVRVGDRIFTTARLDALVDTLRMKFGERVFHPRELRETLGYSRQWTDQLAFTLEAQQLLGKSDEGWILKQGT
jgi:hypothetical protein